MKLKNPNRCCRDDERQALARSGSDEDELGLVQPARLELALLDPQVARELGIVAANLLDEALCVLAPDERLEASPSGWSGEERRSMITSTITRRA